MAFLRAGGTQDQLTQRIVLSGDNARKYVEQIDGGFRATLAPGMARIASEMAAASSKQAG